MTMTTKSPQKPAPKSNKTARPMSLKPPPKPAHKSGKK